MALLIVVTAAAAFVVAGAAHAYPSGGTKDDGRQGCTSCHGATARGSTMVFLDGAPFEFVPGRVYNITLRVEAENIAASGYRGGFAVDADGGELQITDRAKTWFYPGSLTLTQTTSGAYDVSWRFAWKAPQNQSIAKLHYTGLVIPAGNPSLADDPWNNQTRVMYAETSAPLATSSGPAKKSPAVAPFVFVAALVALIACARKGDA